jgi:thymidine kinase
MKTFSRIRGAGWIEVIAGPMFSGKTEELIRRLKRAEIAQQRVQIFKPRLDKRYSEGQIVSHSEQMLGSTALDRATEIFDHLLPDTKVVGIDEVQFFGAEAVPVCQQLADQGLRVIVAGLDQDYRGAPFDPVPQLMAIAEYVSKELAVCVVCGNPAGRSQRLVDDGRRILLGATGAYEARCRACFEPGPETRPAPTAFPEVKVLYSAEAIADRVRALGAEIAAGHRGGDLLLLGVLKGSFVFLADLARAIPLPLRVDFLDVSSYGAQTESSGLVKITRDLRQPIEGAHVVLVEDVVDTGLTMTTLLEELSSRRPASIEVCALLEKPARSKHAVPIHYRGFLVPDAFVVGYGLDHDERYRNLPFVGILDLPAADRMKAHG